MQGKIIKGIAGFYYVAVDESVYECRAKGIFRKQKIKPVVGDLVRLELLDEEEKLANIIEIMPRKNFLIRPLLSNIDLMLLVMSVQKPLPQFYLLDKYLIYMESRGLDVAIVWNKMDLAKDREIFEAYENSGYDCLYVSTYEDMGMDSLREYITHKSVAFAGPSGVGKSSLLNKLSGKSSMEVGGISSKIERGRHTTRHSEIFALGEYTYIYDTPGFSSIDISDIAKEELAVYYPEMKNLPRSCKFSACSHISEPGCAVKEELENGNMSKLRYDNYIKIYRELEEIRRFR